MKRTCIVTIDCWSFAYPEELKNKLHGKTFATVEDVRKFANDPCADEGVHVYDIDIFLEALNEGMISVEYNFVTFIMFEGEAENPFNFD